MDAQHELSPQAGVDMQGPGLAQSPDVGKDFGNLETLTERMNLQHESQEDSSAHEMEVKVSELSPFVFEDTTLLSKRIRDQVIAAWALVRIFRGPNSHVVRNMQADGAGWRSFRVWYDESEPESDIDNDVRTSAQKSLANSKSTNWMDKVYEVHTRLGEQDIFKKMICNSVWAPEQIYAWDPSRRYWTHRNPGRPQGEGIDEGKAGAVVFRLRIYEDVMSTDWAYDEYTKIYDSDPTLEQGVTLVPILLYIDSRECRLPTGPANSRGSKFDAKNSKRWHVVHGTIGNVISVERPFGHPMSLIPCGFLEVPEDPPELERDTEFNQFKNGLLNSAIAKMLEPMADSMSTTATMRCLDGNQRKVVHRVGPICVDWPKCDPIVS